MSPTARAAAPLPAVPPPAVPAAPTAALQATFTPKRLGAATTVTLRLRIDPPPQALPAALSALELLLPANLGLASSGLGLASCEPAALAAEGEQVCPPDSKMGQGEASAGVAFGPETVREHVTLGLYAAPSDDGYIHLAIVAVGKAPIVARIVMLAVLLPGRLSIQVPLVPSLPGAPAVALLALTATLGGNLTYYEHVHGHLLAYRPRGIGLPPSLPPRRLASRRSARVPERSAQPGAGLRRVPPRRSALVEVSC